LQARFDILVSIPGVGQATALAVLVEMPELGTLEHRCAASLAGLAPMARDSGQRSGKRFIRGGRAHAQAPDPRQYPPARWQNLVPKTRLTITDTLTTPVHYFLPWSQRRATGAMEA
jgi:transposase